MELLGRAKIKFTHADQPATLKTKEGSPTDLLQICREATPPCQLNPFLFNGHLQTMWTAVKDDGPPVFYKRKIFDAEDPAYEGTFAVDFVVDPYVGNDESLPVRTTYFTSTEYESVASLDDRPMLVALHGLSGGSYEVYLRHVLAPLVGQEGGWEACVVNARGCAQHKITSTVLFNARATWDIRQTVKWLRNTFPNRPLFGVGFSLGANILVNVGRAFLLVVISLLITSSAPLRKFVYLGEEGSTSLLHAAVVVSNPWNLDIGSVCLQRTWLGMEVYSRTMGTNMKKLFELHADQITRNPRLDPTRVRAARYLHDFDREVQGPTWGYPTVGAYYRDASSSDSLLAVRVPMLAINATDDPIAANESIPYDEFKQNPYTILCTTSLGGHLSWFELGGHRWNARPAVNFLNTMAFKMNLSLLHVPASPANADGKFRSKEPTFDPIRRKLYVK